LKRGEYFGQYGRIVKLVVNRTYQQGDPKQASASAYVTFQHKEDARACIQSVDNVAIDGRVLK
jgi:CCR4-NOT transcription complex subunit 4